MTHKVFKFSCTLEVAAKNEKEARELLAAYITSPVEGTSEIEETEEEVDGDE